ncbi:MAG TPA: hypothetical protein VMV93_02250 [Chloroflexota bacterium]|nr:hypothetical protein [Chloroflexota bacterium]
MEASLVLVPTSHDVAPRRDGLPAVNLAQVMRSGSGRQVAKMVANLKAALEERLLAYPDEYDTLVLLGELNLRVGLVMQARDLLFSASLQPPPSWATYQRTSYLLRRAEERAEKAFSPFPGIAPPVWLRRAAHGAFDAISNRSRGLPHPNPLIEGDGERQDMR